MLGGQVRLGVLGASLVAAMALVSACGTGTEGATGSDEPPRGSQGEQSAADAGVIGRSGQDAGTAAAPQLIMTMTGGLKALNPKWSFNPRDVRGYENLRQPRLWGANEAKLRRFGGKRLVLTTGNRGLAAVVEFRSKRRYWAANVGDPQNPHSIELIPKGPRGMVAVASPAGREGIALYPVRRGQNTSAATDREPLRKAHGVHWDGHRQLLWALGDKFLTAYRIGGTAARPKLVQDKAIGSALPAGEHAGHDLSPVPGTKRLWVATGSRVHQYDPDRAPGARRWVNTYPGSARLAKRVGVKSVTTNPTTGRIAVTAANRSDQLTDRVDFLLPGGMFKTGGYGRIYKARWFQP
ncbi:DUF6528 family protein [Streptomyces monticola]|uniref:DUF6528 family protein n=1 Tax=Streptomyces monticola TaxID=2666263 RepID=A0ABW2JNL4_9ACTN